MGLITQSKLRSNPESNVGLLTLGGLEVLTTLTTDSGKILAKLTGVQPKGDLNLIPGIKIAHLALKHRLGKNHKMRIVAFVGSPVGVDEKDLVKLAKKLKKEKVPILEIQFQKLERGFYDRDIFNMIIPSFYMNVGHFSKYSGHPNKKFQTFLKNSRVQVGVYL